MSFKLPQLPYELDALEPHISKETLEYHYGKHHQTYVNKLNDLVKNKPEANQNLQELILSSSGAIFNNAAQIWNHSFYWECLSPNGGGSPTGQVLEAINSTFESFDNFKQKFTEAAINTFGSGWAWLVKTATGSLEIVSTSNAGNPLTQQQTPILTCDVWEHAYYIDYRNSRPNYLDAFWKLINWEFVEKNI